MMVLVINTGYLAVPPHSAGPLIGGSIELHTYYLVNELARLGNEVHYVTSVNENASFVNGITLHKLPNLHLTSRGGYPEIIAGFATGGFFAFKSALRAINKNQYDIVHAHGSISGAFLLPLRTKFKYVFTVHNRTPWMLVSSSLVQAFRKVVFNVLDLKVIRNANRVITVSENLKKEMVNRFKIDPMKVDVIPNGVDSEFFKPSILNSSNIRTKHGIDHDYALFVGRLVEEKAVHYIIDAIAGTKLHVVIVGDGPLLPFLHNLAVRLDVDRQVHFVGSVSRSELPKFYAEATLFVLPSIAEGLPLTGLEAMASGLPIIASRTSGMEDIVSNNYNGFIIDPMNTTHLRERLIQLFEDTSLRRIMGERSRRIVETQYSWEQNARRTQHLYEIIA